MASFAPIRALTRGLEILRLLSEAGPSTATALARSANLPQPTVIRVLETLIAAGYVYRIANRNEFGVTARTLALSRGFDANSRIVQLAEPPVEKLRSIIGWPSNLAVYVESEASMSIAYTNRSTMGLSVPGRLGARLPLLVTGVGLVYLAYMSDDARAGAYEVLKRSKVQWDTDLQFWQGLDQRLAEIRDSGFAFADEAYLNEVYNSRIWAVAVPILANGEVVAAISTLVLQAAGPKEVLLTQVLPHLMNTASEIGGLLAQDAFGLMPQDLIN